MKKQIIFLSFLLFTVNLLPQNDTTLTFNEIMFKTNSGTNSEFIELYNTSETKSIDLNNFKIKYHTSSNDIIVSAGFGTVLSPKSYAVIFEGDYNLSTGIYNGRVPSSALILKLNNKAFGSSGMANSSNRKLILMNSAGDILDDYTYSANNTANISDEKILLNKNNSSSNWSNTLQTKGTPGFKNSVTPLNFDLVLSSLTTSPSINLEGKTITINATVKNTGKQTASNYTIELYNDTNFDSVTAASEKIFTQSFTNLLINDSTTVSNVISNPSAGNINLIAKVIFANDEDTTNNLKFKLLTVFPIQHLFNDIVVNEIMYAPSSGQTEWVELYNRTDSSVNINGWTFADNKTTVTLTNNDVGIPSKSFIVISKDSSVLDNYDVPVQLVVFSNMPSLNNSGDAVVVKDSIGVLIDSLTYISSWGGSSGKSLERIDVNNSSTNQNNWGTSINTKGATPGIRNSITPFDNDLSLTALSHSPQFIIEGNDVNISATIKNIGKNTAPSFAFNLYNDANNDDAGTTDEIIFTQNYSNLVKSDSLNVSINYLPPTSGNYKIIAEIIFATDDNTTNNKRTDNFTVISEPNKYNNIVVNEIMYAPPSSQSEWVEIYNKSDSAVNIKNWKFADKSTTVTITKNNFIIPPKSFVILSSDSSLLSVFGNSINLLIIPNIPSLNNGGDAVVLHDSLGLKIDGLSYLSSWGGKNGKSLERINVNDSSNRKTNWGTATNNNGATPGRLNSITIRNFDLSAAELLFDPLFPIAGDNVTPSLKIINNGQSNANNFSVQFFIDTNSDNIPNQLLDTESNINLDALDSTIVTSPSDIEDIQSKVVVGAKIIFAQDEDFLNNYVEGFTQSGVAQNSLVINEVMYSPETGQPEWFEIINKFDNPVNLKNWSVSDVLPSSTKNLISASDFFLNPNEFLIITKDSSFFNIYPNLNSKIRLVNFGSLGNTRDGIILYDFRDAKIDSLFYSSNWGGSKGFSLERIFVDNPTNDSTNWTTSLSVNHSTPGAENSIRNITSGTKGEIVINEIMYNPGEENTEFIEFYNNSAKDVNIGGWKITDENGNENILSSVSLIIPSKNYFILSADSSLLVNYKLQNKIVSIKNTSSLGLSNSGELILLKDFLGNEIDSVFYSDKWNNRNFTDTKNKSLERINPNFGGNNKNNWSTSVSTVGATPGEQNSIFTIKLQTQSNLTISPNPFSPDNDGFEDFTIISYNLSQPIAQVKVKIFDSRGRLVRMLDNNLASGSNGSIIFNGLDDSGNPLRIGIYIVYLEALNQNSGAVEAMKAALVVARKFN